MEDSKNWIEIARETFDIAVEGWDYPTCRMVIDDMFDKGFTKESLVLEDILSNTPLSKFAITSPWN